MFKKALLNEDERRVYDDLIYEAARMSPTRATRDPPTNSGDVSTAS